jgi:hypothetical protein
VQLVRSCNGRNSLRAIAADLAARGYVNANGKEFSAASVASMLSAYR